MNTARTLALLSRRGGTRSSFTPATLADSLTVDWWYAPTASNPGYDAVAESEIFTRTGTPTGYFTGPRGQEIVRTPTSGAHYAKLNAGTFSSIANPWKYLDNTSKFWLFFLWNPRGSVVNTNGFFWNGGNNNSTPGLRVYGYSTGDIVCTISDDEVHGYTGADVCHNFDANLTNAYLIQFDLSVPYMNFWSNSHAAYAAGSSYRVITSAVWDSSESTHSTEQFQIGSGLVGGYYCQGDLMAAGGRGVLTDRQAAALLNYGRGLRYSDLSETAFSETDFYRGIVDSDDAAGQKIRIAGKYDYDPTLKLYLQGADKHTRGSLVDTKVLTKDENGRASATFTGLTNATDYHLVTEYGGVESLLEGRYKTLRSGFDGTKFVAAGCWDFESSSVALKSVYAVAWQNIRNRQPDFVVTLGDDIYGDTTWTRELSESGVPETRAEMEQVADNQEPRWQLQNAARSLMWNIGCQSDHDLMDNDQEYDASNMAAAVQYTRDRYGNLDYAASGKLYRSWRTPGLTWISLDTRTEMENGVQMMSATQIAWFRTQLDAAVGRGDFIMILSEKPFLPGGTPGPQSWAYTPTPAFQTQRTALFDHIVGSGASDASHNQCLILCSDYHATAVDDGTNQSGFDTGGVTVIPTVLASRLRHGFGESGSGGWSEYFYNTEGGYMLITLADSAGDCAVTVTPYRGATAQTPINFTLEL